MTMKGFAKFSIENVKLQNLHMIENFSLINLNLKRPSLSLSTQGLNQNLFWMETTKRSQIWWNITWLKTVREL